MLLEFVDVAKAYRGGTRGVDGVTLRLGPGLVGLLGPNGAGKSSLMRIAATVTRPTSGQVLFDGADAVARPDPLRRNLGYLPQDFGVYPHLSAREFLSYLAAVKGLPAKAARTRIGELLELFGLAGAGRRPLGKYSGGMLRRVGIAQALLADPRVLIVDEPTAGLDPEQRVLFRNLLADLAGDRVVLLSTHIVSDVESVASDIAIMAGGRLRLRGSPQDLLRQAEGLVWEMTVPAGALAQLRRAAPGQQMVRTDVRGAGPPARRRRPRPRTRCPPPPDLEDAYLTIIHAERRPSPPRPCAARRRAAPGRRGDESPGARRAGRGRLPERHGRPAYLVTLAAAIVLGYLALPPASSVWVVMNAGGYRGVYNSAWTGTVTALAGALWLMGAGFYVVRSAIARDRADRRRPDPRRHPAAQRRVPGGQVPEQPDGPGLHGRRAGGDRAGPPAGPRRVRRRRPRRPAAAVRRC